MVSLEAQNDVMLRGIDLAYLQTTSKRHQATVKVTKMVKRSEKRSGQRTVEKHVKQRRDIPASSPVKYMENNLSC